MSTARTAQSQAIQLQDPFEMSEEHFHFLSLPARLLVFWGCRDAPRFIAGGFMDVDVRTELTHWGCGQNLGLPGGSPCIHTKTAFGRSSCT